MEAMLSIDLRRQVLSVCTVFMLSLCCAAESQDLVGSLHRSDAPVCTSGAVLSMTAAQGTPFGCLALVASRVCICGSHRCVTNGKTVLGRLPPPGPNTKSRLKLTSSVCVKGASLFILVLWPKVQAFVWHTSKGLLRCCPGTEGCHLCITSCLTQVTGIFQKACTLVWHPNFCSCYRGNTLRLLDSGGQQGLCCGPSELLYVFAYFRTAPCGSGFQSD